MTDASMQQPAEKKKDGRAKPKKFHVDREWFERVYLVEMLETRHIAKAIGCVNEHVTAIAKNFGIKPRGRLKRTVPFPRLELDNEEIVRLYVEEKMAAADIGKLMGCTHRPIAARLVEMGVEMRHHNDTKRGAKSKNRIEIDPDTVLEMYSVKYASGQTVADAFGVSRQVIDRILKEAGAVKKPIGETGDFTGRTPRDGEKTSRQKSEKGAGIRISTTYGECKSMRATTTHAKSAETQLAGT